MIFRNKLNNQKTENLNKINVLEEQNESKTPSPWLKMIKSNKKSGKIHFFQEKVVILQQFVNNSVETSSFSGWRPFKSRRNKPSKEGETNLQVKKEKESNNRLITHQ